MKASTVTFVALAVASAVGLLMFAEGRSGSTLRGDGWRHVRTVGAVDMVVVEPSRAKDKGVYQLAAREVCAKKTSFCKVLFWDDESWVPSSMPMSQLQADAMRANWTDNPKEGYRQMLWACDIEPDKSQCFKR